MKFSSRSFLLTIAAVGLLGFLLWCLRRDKGSEQRPLGIAERTIPAKINHTDTQAASEHAREDSVQDSTPESNQEKRTEAYGHQMSEALQSKNVAVEFWGQVVDQDGSVLPRVKIQSSLRHWFVTPVFAPATRFIKSEVETGADGSFYIGGETGDTLSIEAIEKAGYELEPNAKRSFGYNTSEQFRARRETPIIFKMWQTNIHEQLLTGQKSFHIVPDGRSYLVNLKTGTISESGDGSLKVSLKYATAVAHNQTYDWVAELSVMDGGLLEEADPNSSMYLAPANGYTNVFRYEQQLKDGQRGSIGRKRFFLALNSGQEYGRITVEIIAPYNDHIPGLLRIQHALNPSGSRILR